MERLKKGSDMVLANTTLLMGTSMRECGKRINDMVQEFIITQMEKCIEATINLVKETDLGCSITRMEIGMRGSGKSVI